MLPTAGTAWRGDDGFLAVLMSMRRFTASKETMNTIIYIVGLVVIIGVVLSYFGFR